MRSWTTIMRAMPLDVVQVRPVPKALVLDPTGLGGFSRTVAISVCAQHLRTAPSTLANLEAALDAIDRMGGGMRVGLFDDTWAWGKRPGGPS
jgi:hypothetical protein